MKPKLVSLLIVVALLVGSLGVFGTLSAGPAPDGPAVAPSTSLAGSSPGVSAPLLPALAFRAAQPDLDGPQSDDPVAFPTVQTERRIEANPVLIIQDQLPWGFDSIQQVLTGAGIGYDMATSAAIPALNLDPYELVVIPSVQPDAYYTALNAHITKFEDYVIGGGKLWMSGCTQGVIPIIPGGVINSYSPDNYNVIAKPDHPWVLGVPNPMYGGYANHNVLTNLPPRTVVVATAQTSGLPTLIEYNLGAGHIAVTGQTLEITYAYGWDGTPILRQSLLYMFDYPPDIYVPVVLRHYPFDPYFEPNDHWLDAYGPLASGQVYQAYPDDGEDYYTLTLPGARTVDVVVSNYTPTSDNGQLLVYGPAVGNERGPLVGQFGLPGQTEMRIDDMALGAGKYYVRIFTSGAYSNSQLYTLQVTY